MQLSIDLAYAELDQEKQKTKLVNDEIALTENEIGKVDDSIAKGRERQFHLMQMLHALEAHNKETKVLLDQNRDEIRTLESSTDAEIERDASKVKALLASHVSRLPRHLN